MSSTVARVTPKIRAPKRKSHLREQILVAAQDLFYRHGIQNIGVEAIAEAAGSNKMTLYYHFPSKEALVVASLELSAQGFNADWEATMAAHPSDPRAQLLAWLEYLTNFLILEDGRGCAFANAAVEIADRNHPARLVIEAVKIDQQKKLAVLCREGNYEDPELLADKLFLMFEGARVSYQSIGANGPAMRLGLLARSTIDSHVNINHPDPKS